MSWTIKVFSEELSLIILHPQLSRPTVLFQLPFWPSSIWVALAGVEVGLGEVNIFSDKRKGRIKCPFTNVLNKSHFQDLNHFGQFQQRRNKYCSVGNDTFDVWSLLPCSHGVEVGKGTSLQVLGVLRFFENFRSCAISAIGMWWSWGPYWFRYIIRWKCFHFYKGGRLRWKFLRWFLAGFVF